MKKLLSAAFLLSTLLFSVSSYAYVSAPPRAYYNSVDSTYFILKVINKSINAINVTFDSGNWSSQYGLKSSIAPGTLLNYTYVTPSLKLPTSEKAHTTSGTLSITSSEGSLLCSGAWQHTVWVDLGGQHDRFFVNMDTPRCDVSPQYNPAMLSIDSNSGLHHNKGKDKDDTYTLIVQ